MRRSCCLVLVNLIWKQQQSAQYLHLIKLVSVSCWVLLNAAIKWSWKQSLEIKQALTSCLIHDKPFVLHYFAPICNSFISFGHGGIADDWETFYICILPSDRPTFVHKHTQEPARFLENSPDLFSELNLTLHLLICSILVRVTCMHGGRTPDTSWYYHHRHPDCAVIIGLELWWFAVDVMSTYFLWFMSDQCRSQWAVLSLICVHVHLLVSPWRLAPIFTPVNLYCCNHDHDLIWISACDPCLYF